MTLSLFLWSHMLLVLWLLSGFCDGAMRSDKIKDSGKDNNVQINSWSLEYCQPRLVNTEVNFRQWVTLSRPIYCPIITMGGWPLGGWGWVPRPKWHPWACVRVLRVPAAQPLPGPGHSGWAASCSLTQLSGDQCLGIWAPTNTGERESA